MRCTVRSSMPHSSAMVETAGNAFWPSSFAQSASFRSTIFSVLLMPRMLHTADDTWTDMGAPTLCQQGRAGAAPPVASGVVKCRPTWLRQVAPSGIATHHASCCCDTSTAQAHESPSPGSYASGVPG